MKQHSVFYQGITHSVEETQDVAKLLQENLAVGDVVFFQGDLGSGKTTMIKHLCFLFGVLPEEVTSPTFTFLNEYKGEIPLYHFDLWRLEDPEEFYALGFDEYLPSENGVTFLEWPEKICSLKETSTWKVLLKQMSACKREITLFREQH